MAKLVDNHPARFRGIDGRVAKRNGRWFFLSNDGRLNGCNIPDRRGYSYSWFLDREDQAEVEMIKAVRLQFI